MAGWLRFYGTRGWLVMCMKIWQKEERNPRYGVKK